MNSDVTLLGMAIGSPKGPDTETKDDKNIALDPWRPRRVTWDQVLKVSAVSSY